MATPLYIVNMNSSEMKRFSEQFLDHQFLVSSCILAFNISKKIECWEWIYLTDDNSNMFLLPRDKNKSYKCRYSKGRATLDFMDYGIVASGMALEFMLTHNNLKDKKMSKILSDYSKRFYSAINSFAKRDLYLDFINDFKMFSKNAEPVIFKRNDDGDVSKLEVNPRYVVDFNKERIAYKTFTQSLQK